MVTLLEAVERAKLDYLLLEGIAGIGQRDNVIVFYVETEVDRAKVPAQVLGFNTEIRVVGKVIPL